MPKADQNVLPPQGKFASAMDIEAWIDKQARLTGVATAGIAVLTSIFGDPRRNVGPRFVPRHEDRPAHLRRGAIWFRSPPGSTRMHNVGFSVDLFGVSTAVRAWGHERTITFTSTVVTPAALAGDLWSSLVLVGLITGNELPSVIDGQGGTRQVCRLGCDLHTTAPGRFACSCRYT